MDMGTQAIELARQGYAVFPVRHRTKQPLVSWKPLQEEPPTEEQIERWWNESPDANIAIVTGSVSGVVVLDIDGEEGLEILEENGWDVGTTVCARTGSGGFHYYFEHPGVEVRNFAGGTAQKRLEKVDFRGDGGMIVAPPSLHPNGRRYEWIQSPVDQPPSRMPDWLLELCLPSSEKGERSLRLGEGKIREGRRNTELARRAGQLRRVGMKLAEIEAALLVANENDCVPPLPEDEVRRIAESISRYSPSETYPLTDAGNAERLVDRHGEDMVYVPERKSWYFLHGSKWVPDTNEAIMIRALESARHIEHEATTADLSSEHRAKIRKHALRSEHKDRLKAAVVLAQSLRNRSIRDFDVDQWRFNARNGAIDLRTGNLCEIDGEDYCAKASPISYDPDAKAPRFLEFISQITCGDQELTRSLKRAVGYALTGDTTEHCLFYLLGAGRNGKSTFLNILQHVFGDYASNTRPETFMQQAYSGNTNDLAALAGARLVATFEPRHGDRFAENLVKQIAGGDPISCRFLYGEFFTYYPQMKIFIAGNHLPKFHSDNAILERLRIIPFDAYFSTATRDRSLLEKLKGEEEGILAWAVEGCLEWQQHGLGRSTRCSGEDEGSEQPVRNRHLAAFVEDCCLLHDQARTTNPDLWNRYQEWCTSQKDSPLSRVEFKQQVEAIEGVEPAKSSRMGGRYWKGIGLQ